MGLYINPKVYSKDEWAKEFGKEVQPELLLRTAKAVYSQAEDNQVDLLVCLVDNGMFKALAVAYDEREFQCFTLPEDKRPKTWYIIPVVHIKSVCPDANTYIKG